MKRLLSLFTAALLVAGTWAGFSPAEAARPGTDIVTLAQEANGPGGAFEGQLDVLIAAVLAADPSVVETLSGNGQFTVFAPTDAAFGKLNLTPENVASLGQDALTQILLYHVVRGRRDAADVTSSRQLRTLQGDFLMVNGATLTDNVGRNSEIMVTDISASNGIIHVIGDVVLPFAP